MGRNCRPGSKVREKQARLSIMDSRALLCRNLRQDRDLSYSLEKQPSRRGFSPERRLARSAFLAFAQRALPPARRAFSSAGTAFLIARRALKSLGDVALEARAERVLEDVAGEMIKRTSGAKRLAR